MATTLTIGGQIRELRFAATDVDLAERMIVKNGGRAITDVLGNHGGLFTKYELEWLLWGVWRHKLSTEKLQALLADFYAAGGTIYDLQSVVSEALIDSGLYGKRRERVDDATGGEAAAAPADPPGAGTSA